jgi:hypothetical protein
MSNVIRPKFGQHPCGCDGTGILHEAKGNVWVANVCRCVDKCPTCGGERVQITTDARGYDIARDCSDCVPQMRLVHRLNRGELPAQHRPEWAPRHPKQTPLMDAANRWTADCKAGSRGLLMTGGTGRGKSFVLVHCLRRAAARGARVRYVEAKGLLETLKSHFGKKGADDSASALLCSLRDDFDVLGIDELPLKLKEGWQQDTLGDLLRWRHEANRTVLITTNLGADSSRPHEDLEAGIKRVFGGGVTGERMWSRLAASCEVVRADGPDVRRAT